MTNNQEQDDEVEEELEGKAEEIDEGLPEDKDMPAFLKEEVPTGKLDQAKYWLLRGKTSEQLVEEGHNAGTVRTAKSHLVRDGYLTKGKQGTTPKTPKSKVLAAASPGRGMQVFAKGSPPEAMIDALQVPGVDGALYGFEHGMKFGMTILVTAVRIMNEMSIIGSQQVQPLLSMAKTMREGEAMAYKTGADEAAYKAADAMGRTVLPMIDNIQNAVANIEKGAGGDPVRGMMVRTFEPLFKNIIGKVMPGLGMSDEPPANWSRRKE